MCLRSPEMLLRAGVLFISLCATVLFWWGLGRPQEVPGSLAPGERLQCASYTPFREGETPAAFTVTREKLREDFALLSTHLDCIRIYSMKGMELIPEVAREYGLGVIAGAWISRDDTDTENELRLLEEMADRYPDVVRAVLVGNEVLLRRERTAAQLLAYMQRVRDRVEQPVSYGDVWDFWMQNPSIVEGADFVTIHLLPYWENDPTPVDRAIDAVEHAHEEITRRFPGKSVLVGETGWPSEGRRREGSQPGRVSEAMFIRSFVSRAKEKGWRYNLIEAFDQPWKRGQEGAVGGYWGLFDAARQDKGVVRGPVSDLPQWKACMGASLLGFALFALLLRPQRPAGLLALAVAASCLVFHIHLLGLYSRSLPELAWFLGQGGLMAGCALVLARAGRPALPRGVSDALLGWSLVLAFAEVIGLSFDARYRHFPVAVFIVPAWALLAVGLESALWRARGQIIGWAMVVAVPFMLWQETLANVQSLAWCVVVLGMAAGAIRGPVHSGSRGSDPASAATESAAPGAP